MTKEHFEWFAEYIREAPVSEHEKTLLARMVVAAATNFNQKFRTDVFMDAAGLTPKGRKG